MSKFKIGDTVKVVRKTYCDTYWAEDMYKFLGKVGVVVSYNADHRVYGLDIADEWVFDQEWLELVEAEQPVADPLIIKWHGLTLEFDASVPFSRKLVEGMLNVIYGGKNDI